MMAWHEAQMERRSCEYCGQSMLHHQCDECAGVGYYWARDEVGHTPIECSTCHGSGEEYHCTNTRCPGIVWYPLSSSDAAILRMVKTKIGEDGR